MSLFVVRDGWFANFDALAALGFLCWVVGFCLLGFVLTACCWIFVLSVGYLVVPFCWI